MATENEGVPLSTEASQAPAPAGAVFLSYASEDAAAADRIASALCGAGIEVWFDKSELRGGEAWDCQIRRQIHECSLFVPLISAHTNARDEGYFRREWKLAAERTADMAEDVTFLLPVVIDATRDGSARVPDRFREVHWSHAPDGQLSPAFIERVRQLLSPATTQLPSAAQGQRPADHRLRASPATGAAGRYRWLLATAAVLSIAAAIFAGNWLRGGGDHSRIHSLAVLPLANLSQEPGQEYLAEGLTEALTTDLGKLSTVRVISRTSTARFRGTKKSLVEIARELGVDALVEGAVLRSGDRVRVTAQLIEAPSDRHLWAESYDRDLRDVLTLQADVARAIALQVRGRLTAASAVRGGSAANPESYQLFLKGRYARDQGGAENLKLAFEYFRQAIEKDPHYAAAYAELAACYARLPFYSETRPAEAFPKARAAALKALALAPELAEAHAAMAYVKTFYDWDWSGAEQEFKRALALNPNDADAHHSYSRLLASLGRMGEARAELEQAQNLDPLSLLVQSNRGIISYFGRQYAHAIEELRTISDRDPQFFVPYWGIGLCDEQLGRYDDAVVQLQRAIDLSGREANGIASLAHAYGLAGRSGDAQQILKELQERATTHYVSGYQFAMVYLGLHQTEQAMQQLQNALQEHSTLLVYLKMDPRVDPLRNDPRFQAIERALKFPD